MTISCHYQQIYKIKQSKTLITMTNKGKGKVWLKILNRLYTCGVSIVSNMKVALRNKHLYYHGTGGGAPVLLLKDEDLVVDCLGRILFIPKVVLQGYLRFMIQFIHVE